MWDILVVPSLPCKGTGGKGTKTLPCPSCALFRPWVPTAHPLRPEHRPRLAPSLFACSAQMGWVHHPTMHRPGGQGKPGQTTNPGNPPACGGRYPVARGTFLLPSEIAGGTQETPPAHPEMLSNKGPKIIRHQFAAIVLQHHCPLHQLNPPQMTQSK